MCCQFPESGPHASTTYVTHEFQKIPRGMARLDGKIGQFMGIIAYGEEAVLAPIGSACASAAEKTVTFIKNNWRPLVAYIFAWGLIITCTGLMYGFEAVALPLTIGLACGLVFGIITGILTVKVFDPSGEVTIWNFLNQGIERLDPNGTRQIVLAVAITVLLAAAVVFPYVIGAVMGIILGNQLATKTGSGRDLGTDPAKHKNEKEALKQHIGDMEQKIAEISHKMENLESANEKWCLSKRISEMLITLKGMKTSLEKLYPVKNENNK
jgi:hypothetical protein